METEIMPLYTQTTLTQLATQQTRTPLSTIYMVAIQNTQTMSIVDTETVTRSSAWEREKKKQKNMETQKSKPIKPATKKTTKKNNEAVRKKARHRKTAIKGFSLEKGEKSAVKELLAYGEACVVFPYQETVVVIEKQKTTLEVLLESQGKLPFRKKLETVLLRRPLDPEKHRPLAYDMTCEEKTNQHAWEVLSKAETLLTTLLDHEREILSWRDAFNTIYPPEKYEVTWEGRKLVRRLLSIWGKTKTDLEIKMDAVRKTMKPVIIKNVKIAIHQTSKNNYDNNNKHNNNGKNNNAKYSVRLVVEDAWNKDEDNDKKNMNDYKRMLHSPEPLMLLLVTKDSMLDITGRKKLTKNTLKKLEETIEEETAKIERFIEETMKIGEEINAGKTYLATIISPEKETTQIWVSGEPWEVIDFLTEKIAKKRLERKLEKFALTKCRKKVMITMKNNNNTANTDDNNKDQPTTVKTSTNMHGEKTRYTYVTNYGCVERISLRPLEKHSYDELFFLSEKSLLTIMSEAKQIT